MTNTQQAHPHKQTRAIINRLSRIEGHIRSIKGMVEQGRDCSDILIQIAAVRSAIERVGRVVLEDHIESCLLDAEEQMEREEIWAGVKEALDVFL
jgi:DNA-binding FrmR family transcriptional regulator